MVLNIKHQTAYSQSLVEFVLLVFFNFLYCVVFVFSRLSIVDCPFGFLSFLYCVLFVFVMCAVFPVSLDCPLLIVPSVFLAFYIVFCLFSSCVLCSSFSRLSIVDCPFGSLSFLYCVLFVFVMCAVFPVYLDCPLLIDPSVYLAFYIVFCLFSSCVLCFQFIWMSIVVLSILCFVCFRHVCCVSSFSRLSIVDCPFGFLSFLYCVLFVFVMCAVFPVSLDCPLLIVPSVFLVFYIVFCLFSSCVLVSSFSRLTLRFS